MPHVANKIEHGDIVMLTKYYKLLFKVFILIVATQFFLIPPLCHAADYFDWSVRTDRDGKPAGIFESTPFPIDENSTTYAITNDEGTKTFTLGTLYFVDGAKADDTGDGLSLANAKKTIAAAVTVAGNGNKTIIVRGAHDAFDGTYTDTNIALGIGTDDTHRWMIVGYKDERPVIDGGNSSTNYIFKTSGTENAYATLQRLKTQNTQKTGLRFGTTASTLDSYVNLIDVWIYDTAKNTTVVAADGNVYFLGSHHPWLYHCTSSHTMGHGIKIGDGADYATVEWCNVYECGYWTGFPENTDWGTHPSGIDLPSDPGQGGTDYKVRYNICHTTYYNGVNMRRLTNFSFHHNEVYNTPNFDKFTGEGTYATKPQVLILYGSGSCYSNVVRDCPDAQSGSCGIATNQIADGDTVSIYNNLIYGDSGHGIWLYGYLPSAGSTRTINVYNNSIYINNGSFECVHSDGYWADGEVHIKNNIMYQNAAGSCMNLDNDIELDYNQYYYPNGGRLGETAGANDRGTTGSGEDPLWVRVPSGTYDTYDAKLQSSSPGINQGLDLSGVVTNAFNATTRPQSSDWDIGAIEYDQTSDSVLSQPSNLRIK